MEEEYKIRKNLSPSAFRSRTEISFIRRTFSTLSSSHSFLTLESYFSSLAFPVKNSNSIAVSPISLKEESNDRGDRMPHWCFYEEVAIASYDLLGEEFTLRMKRGGSEIAIGRTVGLGPVPN
ncbi:unnamed protein product [Ilex paraguariensis]|uniref:Uncharacterized protein n=1 Tax=Ilex paraguariensis TaxID=185542 RepID=A0ABC8TEU9_9AQUA